MDLFKVLQETFKFEKKTMQELLEISAYIDLERSQNGYLKDRKEDFAVIASTIVALLCEESTFFVGKKLEELINSLIVEKNLSDVSAGKGEIIMAELGEKSEPGIYTVRNTAYGYKFDLVAPNGKILAVSEVYSTLKSCLNGIEAVRKNCIGNIEDQTECNYKSVRNPKYEIYCDKGGNYRFRLKAMNGQILMVSEGYKSMKECTETIHTMQKTGNSEYIEKM